MEGLTDYNKARDYLIETNQLHLLERELSTDGYTLIALANILLKDVPKRIQPQTIADIK